MPTQEREKTDALRDDLQTCGRLVRGPTFFLGEHVKAGVVVHCPPAGQADNPATPEAPIYVELVVDGDVVDLNRMPLPADTPIIDERFKDGKNR